MLQYIYTTIFFNQNHLWQLLSSISDPPRSERTKRPTSYTTCLTPPATNSNGCAADTHRTAGVARLEALRFHGAKWGHFAICLCFYPQEYHCHFFSIFAPSKPPPMSRCRTYPFVHPLRGCGNTRGDAHPYQAPVPVGTWWAGDLRPCRAFAPNGMRDATTNILAHVTFPPHRHDGKTMDTLSLQHRRHNVPPLQQLSILHSQFFILSHLLRKRTRLRNRPILLWRKVLQQ